MLSVSTLNCLCSSQLCVLSQSGLKAWANPNEIPKERDKSSCCTSCHFFTGFSSGCWNDFIWHAFRFPPGLLFDIYLHVISFFIFWKTSKTDSNLFSGRLSYLLVSPMLQPVANFNILHLILQSESVYMLQTKGKVPCETKEESG